MKKSEINKIYKKYLKDSLPENYALKGNLIYKIPVDNLLIGFCFSSSGNNRSGFYLHAFVQPLYVLDEDVNLTFGYRVKCGKIDFWEINSGDEKNILNLVSELNRNISDFLSKINSPTDFYNFYKDKCENLRMFEAIALSACYDLLEDRVFQIDHFLSKLEKENLSIDWIKKLYEQASFLKMNINNIEILKSTLDQWENTTKKNLKL